MGQFLEKISKLLTNASALKAILVTVKAVMIGIAAAFAIMNPIAAIAGLATYATIKAMDTTEDGIAPPGNGPFTIKDGYGRTSITAAGDGLAVSPNITRNNNTGGGGSDMSGVISELSAVKAVLSQILAKEGVVYMDSTKVGTSMNIGTYKTQ
jgi:hypothetical protein